MTKYNIIDLCHSTVAWTLSRFSARAQVPWERAEKRLGVQANSTAALLKFDKKRK